MTADKNFQDALEIMNDLIYELHHQVHRDGCKCAYAIRKLRHAMEHLRLTWGS